MRLGDCGLGAERERRGAIYSTSRRQPANHRADEAPSSVPAFGSGATFIPLRWSRAMRLAAWRRA
jgi:hypothetical protein